MDLETVAALGDQTPLAELYGNTPAEGFGPRALKAIRERFIADDLCRQTVNKYIGAIKRMFEWATSEELIPPAVHEALRTVKDLHKGRSNAREGARIRPVPEGYAEKVMAAVSPQVADMIRVELRAASARTRGCNPES